MPSAGLTTYQDLVDHLIDFVEGDVSGTVERDARRSAQEALRDLANRHPWTLYYGTGRVVTVPPYQDGTVTYDHTGGTYERQLTLAGGTWPDWAAFGHVVLTNVRYEVAERKSATVLTLTSASNPGADVTDATDYSLRRDTYPLPLDFVAADEFINVNQVLSMQYSHPRWWLARQRLVVSPSYPTIYTFMGDPNYYGNLAAFFYPPPDAVYQLDYLYRRRPRPLEVLAYTDGTVSLAGGTATVSGTGTNWLARHKGCVFRIGGGTSDPPTGRSGKAPADYERVVASVDSATQLTLDSTIADTYSGVKASVSDPVDIEDGTMLNALLACCEYWMARCRNMKDRAEIEQRWLRELERAQEADSRSLARRSAGAWPGYGRRLAHMPAGQDLP